MSLHGHKNLLAVISILLVSGCASNHYMIEMETTGKELKRTITCWRSSTSSTKDSFPADTLKHISEAYKTRATKSPANKHVFTGKFSGDTPNDVGGAGSYTHLTSDMGTLSCYAERFRGMDDLAAALTKKYRAVDELTDILIGWSQSELRGDKRAKKLRKFLDEDFRQDAKNLILYFFVGVFAKTDSEPGTEEIIARACQYLAERNYFKPEEIPSIAAASYYDTYREGSERVMAIIQRLVADKAGISDKRKISSSLGFLSSRERVEKSLEKYLRTTKEFKEELAGWEEEKKTDPKAAEPSPLDRIEKLLFEEIIYFEWLGDNDQLTVKLRCNTEPFFTNSEYDAKTKEIVWPERSIADNNMPAAFCYAVWSDPDVKFQKTHFGMVVLEGSDLGDYVTWHNGLDAKDAAEWDKFVSKLKPSETLKAELESFLFSQERKLLGEDGKRPNSMADTPRNLILQNMKKKPIPETPAVIEK